MNARLLVVPLCVALGSCVPPLPDPQVLEVSPSEMMENDSLNAEVTVNAVLPFHVSYGPENGSADSVATVLLGGQSVGFGQYLPGGSLPIFVPSIFVPGIYDLGVRLDDGRAGTLPSAFKVTTGAWPTGYLVDPIADQAMGVPFSVTIFAQGPAAAGFHGTVWLSSSQGAVSPGLTGPFSKGARTEIVTVTFDGGARDVSLTVGDLNNANGGTSNTFHVSP